MSIYSRLKEAVSEQNWFAVGLEVIILMMGLLLAFQVDRWYEGQQELKREADYLIRLQENVNEDIQSIDTRLDFYLQVKKHGDLALSHQEKQITGEVESWDLLVAYFQASQIWPLVLSNVTYEELRSAGELDLIRNVELRRVMSLYYGEQYGQYEDTIGVIPKYRERIRGEIPFHLQEAIWVNCHKTQDSYQFIIACDKPSNVKESDILKTIQTIESGSYINDLRFWMSSIYVGIEILQSQKDLGVQLSNMITDIQEGA